MTARIAALLALVALFGAADPLASARPARWQGLSLQEALRRLETEGLRLIYSSDLVAPDLAVLAEPEAETLHEILEEILAPHGLAARVGPGGSLLVVRADEERIAVRLLTPVDGTPTVGRTRIVAEVEGAVERVELLVDGRPVAVLREPPWETSVSLLGRDPSWRIAAVAHGRRGAVARDEVVTRNLVVEEKLDVALRHVSVSILDAPGGPLGAEDFRLQVDGREVPIATFERGDAPLSAALLVDASESMREGSLAAALAGARAFVERLGPRDEAMALLFSDRVRAIGDFGSGVDAVVAPLAGAEAAGSTALHDHLYLALGLLEGRVRRPVLILLSDGADVVSSLTAQEVGEKAAAGGTTLFWIRLGRIGRSSFSSAWRDAEGNRREREGLEAVVGASGGRVVEVEDASGVASAFAGILEDIRDQVVLGYYPGRDDAADSHVVVRSRRPGLRIRQRSTGGA